MFGPCPCWSLVWNTIFYQSAIPGVVWPFAINPQTTGSLFTFKLSFRCCYCKCKISVWNWSNTTIPCSALWILMAWWFSSRASAATVLITHLCISSWLQVNIKIPQCGTMIPSRPQWAFFCNLFNVLVLLSLWYFPWGYCWHFDYMYC